MYGDRSALRRTAAFKRATGVDVWHREQGKRRRYISFRYDRNLQNRTLNVVCILKCISVWLLVCISFFLIMAGRGMELRLKIHFKPVLALFNCLLFCFFLVFFCCLCFCCFGFLVFLFFLCFVFWFVCLFVFCLFVSFFLLLFFGGFFARGGGVVGLLLFFLRACL